MSHPDISIIIVNWRSRDFVKQCLTSIFATSSDLSYEVFVVDNASHDGCVEMTAAEFPQVIAIQSPENLGFSGANNLAFSRSSGRNVLFLNPDTEVLGDAIQRLTARLESIPDAGMVGARLLNSDRSVQTTCITAIPSIANQVLSSHLLKRMFPKWSLWGMKPLFEDSQMPAKVDAISGACMLAKREVLEQVKVFSTEYFMYSEDMDLCVKIANAGWKIYYVPDAAIVHHAGGSSSSRKESDFSSIMLRESMVKFFALHRGRWYTLFYRVSMVFVSICRLCLLAAALPIAIFPQGRRALSRAIGKWLNIACWSLGVTRWSSRHPRGTAKYISATGQ